MTTKFEQFLNYAIPTLIVLAFVAFIWVKTPLGVWLGPHLNNFWLWMKGESQAQAKKQRVITYE
jgi:hypothetical protein